MEIRLQRPEKRNAITAAMYAALADALARAADEAAIRAVLISGEGEAFTAGNDLRDFLARPPQAEDGPVFRFLRAVATAPKPLVAAVQGAAVGIGVTMLLHCDLVVAAANARFSLPFVNLGLVPEAASSLLLPRLVGHQRAAEMLLLGEAFDAEAARACGLVNRVVAEGDLIDAARTLAGALAARPPEAVRLAKALLKGDGAAVAGRMAEENRHFRERLKSAELREAVAAFFEKRAPDFAARG